MARSGAARVVLVHFEDAITLSQVAARDIEIRFLSAVRAWDRKEKSHASKSV